MSTKGQNEIKTDEIELRCLRCNKPISQYEIVCMVCRITIAREMRKNKKFIIVQFQKDSFENKDVLFGINGKIRKYEIKANNPITDKKRILIKISDKKYSVSLPEIVVEILHQEFIFK